jgi:serine/threonine protein kinase
MHKLVIQQNQRFLYLFLLLFKVHADIKPDNMILVGNVLKITDLGLAFGLASPRQVLRRPTVRGTIGIFT